MAREGKIVCLPYSLVDIRPKLVGNMCFSAQVLLVEASKEPLILFIKNVEKSIIGNFERYMKLERLERTDARLVVIGSHTSDLQKEKVLLLSL